MKQHITVGQVNDLSERGKEKLREWWSPEMGDIVHDGEGEYAVSLEDEESGLQRIFEHKTFNPLLSIGQMIELLDEQEDYFNTAYTTGGSKEIKRNRTVVWEYNEELCDILWKEVKEVLI